VQLLKTQIWGFCVLDACKKVRGEMIILAPQTHPNTLQRHQRYQREGGKEIGSKNAVLPDEGTVGKTKG